MQKHSTVEPTTVKFHLTGGLTSALLLPSKNKTQETWEYWQTGTRMEWGRFVFRVHEISLHFLDVDPHIGLRVTEHFRHHYSRLASSRADLRGCFRPEEGLQLEVEVSAATSAVDGQEKGHELYHKCGVCCWFRCQQSFSSFSFKNWERSFLASFHLRQKGGKKTMTSPKYQGVKFKCDNEILEQDCWQSRGRCYCCSPSRNNLKCSLNVWVLLSRVGDIGVIEVTNGELFFSPRMR